MGKWDDPWFYEQAYKEDPFFHPEKRVFPEGSFPKGGPRVLLQSEYHGKNSPAIDQARKNALALEPNDVREG